MKRPIPIAIALVFCSCVSAFAIPTITAGNHVLVPNSIQVIDILISGGDPIPGLDLYLVVGDNVAGPIITAIDIVGPGTVFNPNNTGQSTLGPPYDVPGRQPAVTTTTASGTVAASGVLAHVTLDTTGIFGGTFSLSLTNPDLGPSDVALDPGHDVILVDGSITLPEPASAVLALGAAGALWAARRWRRAPRASAARA